jgi:LPS sulfotransferase NodH
VSWGKAIGSGKGVDEDSRSAEPEFDADGIAGRVRRIDEHNESWRRWFEANKVEPLAVTYEGLAADPVGTSRRVLEFAGVDVPAGFHVEPRTERQSDSVNADWIRRYRELKRSS